MAMKGCSTLPRYIIRGFSRKLAETKNGKKEGYLLFKENDENVRTMKAWKTARKNELCKNEKKKKKKKKE